MRTDDSRWNGKIVLATVAILLLVTIILVAAAFVWFRKPGSDSDKKGSEYQPTPQMKAAAILAAKRIVSQRLQHPETAHFGDNIENLRKLDEHVSLIAFINKDLMRYQVVGSFKSDEFPNDTSFKCFVEYQGGNRWACFRLWVAGVKIESVLDRRAELLASANLRARNGVIAACVAFLLLAVACVSMIFRIRKGSKQPGAKGALHKIGITITVILFVVSIGIAATMFFQMPKRGPDPASFIVDVPKEIPSD